MGQNLTRVVGVYTTLVSNLHLTKGDRLTIGLVSRDGHERVL